MSDPTELPAVAALLEERNALLGWLDRLDRSGQAAPESVRARVRGDYQARLNGVIDRLRHHSDTIAARLSTDTAEREALEQRARSARESLAEAELRHAVGEYDDSRFEAETAQHNSELAECEQQLDVVAERISHLEDVQAAVSRPAPEPAAEPGLTQESAVAEPVVEPSEPEPRAEPDLESVSDEATESLLSIFDAAGSPPEPAADPVPFEEEAIRFEQADSGPGGATPGFGPLSFTPSDGSDQQGPQGNGAARPKSSPPQTMPQPDSSPRFVRPATDRGSELVEVKGAEAPPVVRVVPDPEPVLPELTREADAAARTLRCGECGAMNRPLEWYCEKCGAELNSV